MTVLPPTIATSVPGERARALTSLPAGRTARIVASLLLGLAGLVPAARAQSADDGFSPAANLTPHAIAVQPDGKIVVGGQFTSLDGYGRNRIGRLHPNGRADLGFNPGANGNVYALAIQPDGKILVGGAFTQLAGAARNGIGRLNPDGTLDQSFTTPGGGAVLDIALQADGRIVVAGTFTTMGGQPRSRIARLHPDGVLDTTFDPGANELVYDVEVQRDGMILVAGGYSVLGGVRRSRLGRLFPDGRVDTAFAPSVSGPVFAMALQEDGRVVVGGSFQTLGGQLRPNLGRLNPDGNLDQSFAATAGNHVLAIALQPDGRIVVGGSFLSLAGGDRMRLGRLLPDGRPDDSFVAGTDGQVESLAVQPDGAVVVGGTFSLVLGQPRTRLARITPGGRMDATFTAGTNQEVQAMAVQADGRLVVGGYFTSLSSGTSRQRLARFRADGTLDETFAPSAGGAVFAIAVQDDGKLLVGGLFTTMNGEARGRLVRLRPDGTLDGTFLDTQADSAVYAIAVQEDGRILVAGAFTSVRGVTRQRLARLNTDGSVDTSFAPALDGLALAVATQPDGKILVGGAFSVVDQQARPGLARLHADGTLDTSFNAQVEGQVTALALQADGRILVGGPMTLGGTPARGLDRLHPDGTLEDGFGVGEGLVRSIAVQADGRITVGGSFSRFGNVTRTNLARVNSQGKVDGSFTIGTGPFSGVLGLALDAQGKLAVGGDYTTLGGIARPRLGRANSFTAATGALRVRADGTRIDWVRDGAGPEVSGVTFDLSLDGVVWTALGKGSRRSDGWRIEGVSLPFGTRFFVRARGRYTGGLGNGSQSVIESVRAAYLEQDPDKDGLPTAWELVFGTDPRGYDRDGDLDGDGLTNAAEYQQGSHPNGTFVRYLAEGATSSFFRTRLALLNPDVAPASVVLRFLREDGSTGRHEVWLDGRSRATVDVGDLPGMAEAPAFATVLEADRTVVLDRTMTWDATGYGSHTETSLVRPELRWYLAEGATHSGFALFYLLQNPNPVPADVRVTFLLPQGAPLVRTYSVAPTSRLNVWVNHVPGLESTDVSATIEVTNGRPIVVERAMYLTRGGQLFSAGHASAGVPSPTTAWFLAEGATGPYFDLFVLLANPDPSQAAQVDLTYLLPDGGTRRKRYTVAPQSRLTVWVDEEAFPGEGKVLADTSVSVRVDSFNQVPIVVERAMWWPGTFSSWHEAHNSAGSTNTGLRWALAEGEEGGPHDAETFILVANVSSFASTVRVTLLFEDGTNSVRTFVVPATSRFNVQVGYAFPEAAGRRFGALVEAVGTPAELVVERAMYSNSGGVHWAAGTNALGTRLQ